MMRKSLRLLLALSLLATPFTATAVLTIEITQGVAAGIPIAVVPFEYRGSGAPPHVVSDIVEGDLVLSGRFDSLPRQDFLSQPHDHGQVKFKDWRLIKAEALLIGRVTQVAGDAYNVEFRLYDVFNGKQLTGYIYQKVPGARLRRIAHQVSDVVYEKLTGERGAFDTRIAYVTAQPAPGGTRQFLLQVADYDGFGPTTILQSREPILSPAWSPDGAHLAYVSFEEGRSKIYVQRLHDGKRRKLAEYAGLNGAPAWSPDGRRLALTLSRDGNPEIYVTTIASGEFRRLTQHTAIDTEPAWSPDGRHIVFTSDRGGKPQIYRISSSGGRAERLTFEGRYNARASYSSDGERLTLVTNQGDGYRIGIFFIRSRSLQVLTDSQLDESPSFAPNAGMVLYATEAGGTGVLAAVSADGRVKQRLKLQQGDVREPAWSPFYGKL